MTSYPKVPRQFVKAKNRMPYFAGQRTVTVCLKSLALSAILIAVTACRSAYVEAVITNRLPLAVTLIQVDYPSASFGRQNLASGESFKYRLKVLGSGTTRLSYTDQNQQEVKSVGPELKEGDEGRVSISIERSGVQWDVTKLTRKH
jgi:hypothetical protein